MSTTMTELNKRLPVESVTGTVSDLADAIVETVQKVGHVVGDYVPDAVPEVVHDAVNEGMTRGRRVLDRVPFERLPGVSPKATSQKRRMIIIGSLMIVVIGAVLVVRRRRARAFETATADNWSTSDPVRSVA